MAISIFISYGHNDNDMPPQWVSDLTEHLKDRLQTYGAAADLWFDESNLGGEAVIWDRIKSQLDSAQILVPIISGRYITSESCLKEFRYYYEAWAARGGLSTPGDTIRVVKVVKVPVERGAAFAPNSDFTDAHKSTLMESSRGVAFYRNTKQGAPVELLFKDDTKEYMERLGDLAFAIGRVIKQLQGQARPSRAAIFVADTAPDQSTNGDIVRRELEDRGHLVLPSHEFCWTNANYMQRIEDALEHSEMSIHVIGARRGMIPDDGRSDCGATQLQLEAAQRVPKLLSRHLVWIPRDVRVEDAEDSHAVFLRKLLDGDLARAGVEVVRTADELWTEFSDRLPAPEPLPASARQRVFLICHEADVERVQELIACFEVHDFDVLTPVFDADVESRKAVHRQYYAMSAGVMLFYGEAPDSWFKQSLAELIEQSGSTSARQSRAVYVAGPSTPAKHLVRGKDPHVIKEFGPFREEALRLFFENLTRLSSSNGRPH